MTRLILIDLVLDHKPCAFPLLKGRVRNELARDEGRSPWDPTRSRGRSPKDSRLGRDKTKWSSVARQLLFYRWKNSFTVEILIRILKVFSGIKDWAVIKPFYNRLSFSLTGSVIERHFYLFLQGQC